MGIFTNSVRSILGNGNGRYGRIDRLCAEIGWSIDERDANKLTLNFRDPLVITRPVHIASGDDAIVFFGACSLTLVHVSQVPAEVFVYLLMRNNELPIGKWQLDFDDERNTYFSVVYSALGEGLTPAALKLICEGLVREASEFDVKMHRAGLLRL